MGDVVYPEEKLQPYRTEAWRCLFWIGVSLVVAVSVLFLSFIPSLMLEGQTTPLWFQRSGSITTIGALVIGLFVGRLRDNLEGRCMGSVYGQHVFKEIRMPFNVAAAATVVLTVVGTVVWGYGDLIVVLAQS